MNRASKLLFGSGENYAHYVLGQAVQFRRQAEATTDSFRRKLLRQSMRQHALAYTREILALEGRQFSLADR